MPTGFAHIARAQDPNQKAITDWIDSIRSRTPGLSEDVPDARGLWGHTIDRSSGLGAAYDFTSPFISSKKDPFPIDREMDRLELYVGRPRKSLGFDGVNINLKIRPEIYNRYLELQGHALTELNGFPIDPSRKGLVDVLNLVVTGQHPDSRLYGMLTDGPDGGKANYIEKTVADFREAAKWQLVDEFPWLEAQIDERRDNVPEFFKFQATGK